MGVLPFASRFAGAGISLTLFAESVAIATDKGLSSRLRIVAAVAAVAFLVVAFGLFVSAMVVYKRLSNKKLTLVSHDSTTVSGSVLYVQFSLLRLRFVNKGPPGEFHAMAWWVKDGRRSGDVWDVCWQNTSDTTVFIESEKVMNLLGLVAPRGIVPPVLSARPMRPAFPVGELHTSQRDVGDDWRIEVDVWRVSRKNPLRSLWQVEGINEKWRLSEVDGPLPDSFRR